MKQILYVVLLALTANSFGQTSGTEAEMNLQLLGTGSIVRSFDNRYEGVLGHPFLYDEWRAGGITLSGIEYQDLQLKYDVYADEVIMKRSSGDSMIVTSGIIKRFNIEHRTFIYLVKVKQMDSKSDIGFFELLYEGKKVSLLKKLKKTLVQADYKGAYNAGNAYDEFKPAPHIYYVMKNSESLWRLKPKKKDISRVLDKQVEAYISSQKLNLKKEDELVAVVKYFDEEG